MIMLMLPFQYLDILAMSITAKISYWGGAPISFSLPTLIKTLPLTIRLVQKITLTSLILLDFITQQNECKLLD